MRPVIQRFKSVFTSFVLGCLITTAWCSGGELTVPLSIPTVGVTAGPMGEAVIACADAQWLGQAGEPQIPWYVMTVLLPPDADVGTAAVRFDGGRYDDVKGQWTVGPTPPAATWDGNRQVVEWAAGKTIVNGRDVVIYGRDALWPDTDARLIDTGRLRQYRLAQVAVPLVKYNPVSGVLTRLSAGSVAVSFQQAVAAANGPAGGAGPSDLVGDDTVRRITANYSQQGSAYVGGGAAAGRGAGASGGAAKPGYVIITSSEIQSSSTALADFVAHKNLCGFNAWVITEADFGGGVGDAVAENIRNWLKAHYVSDQIQYVLLIGNPDPAAGDVPMKMLWPRRSQADDREAPSDYYYADLTGNWDRDGDGYYGEWPDDFGAGGVDRHWEVLVGRIPYYGEVADTDWILQKLIRYGLTPSSDLGWRRNVLLPMKPSDDSTPGYHLGERIKTNILVPAGWSYHRIYEETYGLTPPPETTPCTLTNVTNVWKNGMFGLVVWWTHGSGGGASGIMDSYRALSLNDAYPAFTFQVSCTNSQPEVINLSAVLLRNGAASTVGATRVSWYFVGQTQFAGSPSNAGMGYEYASRVVGGGLTSGQALHELKQTISPTSGATWMNFVDFVIYGDPSQGIVPRDYALNVNTVNGSWGQVQSSPEPNTPSLPRYSGGTSVTLTAVPVDGKAFKWWEILDPNHPGDSNYAVIDGNSTTHIVMTTPREVTAAFQCGGGTGAAPPLLTIGLWGMVRLRRGRR